ncbi:Uu.00g136890.m01.CDS01 [Anthostomella pinea]|uniref:Uu.00g136890.m01.CDS01 n=1 Tax=Anthostomella pinea TaxID=933095 RepID=A0AAI8VQ18_9PEZI|nr:Uu.00g136890.m01.CDS01 [Anthostomella pinea]
MRLTSYGYYLAEQSQQFLFNSTLYHENQPWRDVRRRGCSKAHPCSDTACHALQPSKVISKKTNGISKGEQDPSILEKSGQSFGTDAYDSFLAALLLSFAQTFPDRQVPTVWNQEHERASLDFQHDVSETVGWFTSLCPILTSVLPTDDILSVLYHVQDTRQAMVSKVAPFFAASLSDPGE